MNTGWDMMASYVNRMGRLTVLMLLGLFLTACSGDDGREGEAGPAGETGEQGPVGPSGGTALPVDSAEKINIAINSVDVPSGGGAPIVSLTLTNDVGLGLKDLPDSDIRFVLSQLSPGTAGGSSEWQSYVTRDTGGIPDGQATTETATAGDFIDNGDGTYQYTFAMALTDYPAGPLYDETKSHRMGIEIRGQAPISSNGIFNFEPAMPGADPTTIFRRDIVDNDTCNACHDRLEFHGGPRTDVAYCVTCHNPYSVDGDTGNTVDMKALIHNIHAGRDGYVIIGHGGRVHDYSDVVWTQDLRNCQTCHEESDENTPQASNWRLVPNRAACGTCHYDDGIADSGHDYAIEDGIHPINQNFQDDTQCLGCHGPDSAIVPVQIAVAHAIPAQIAAEAFEFDVVSATMDAAGIVTASIRVLDPTDPNYPTDPDDPDYEADKQSTAYDINDPTGPFQLGGSRLRMDVAWTTIDGGNLDPNDELARSPDSGAPFAPLTIDFQSGAVNDGNNTFTKSATEAVPSAISGSGLAVLEGRAAVDIDGSTEELPVSAAFLAFSITDAEPQDRRSIVNIDKCNECHKNLSLHGDNRSGNTEVCSTCHNPNATDINRRVPGSECDTELGLDDAPIDIKRMVHQIHAGATGVCGFRNSAHDYSHVVYPGKLNNCEGCHLPGTYYPVDPAALLATTVDAGADRSTLADDVAISPNAAVCSACHTSELAQVHMEQNGADFAAGKDDTGTLISSGTESCVICHGPGKTADVKAMHKVDEFQFN